MKKDVLNTSSFLSVLILLTGTISSCSTNNNDTNHTLRNPTDTLAPVKVFRVKAPLVQPWSKVPPTVVPLPKSPGRFVVPHHVNYLRDPLPPVINLAPPMKRKGGFYRPIELISTREGLPFEYVREVYATRDGNLWLVPEKNNMVRYDGNRYEPAGFEGRVLMEDSKGGLWVFIAREGLGVFRNGSLIRYGTQFPESRKFWGYMDEDASGNFWFIHDESGFPKLTRFDGKSFTKIPIPDANTLQYGNLLAVTADESVWIGGPMGLHRIRGSSLEHFDESNGLVNREVIKLVKGSQGDLWILTPRGISYYDGKRFTNYDASNGLPNGKVQDLAIDKKGLVWLGIRGAGLVRFDGKTFYSFGREAGLPGLDVKSIVADNTGAMWLLFNDWGGLCRVGPEEINLFRGNTGLQEESFFSDQIAIGAISQDKRGHHWFGADGFAYRYDGNSFEYFSSPQGLLVHGSEGASVGSIVNDLKGRIWFGIAGGSTSIFDGTSFTHLAEPHGADRWIYCLEVAKDGSIWAGTPRFGLIHFRGEEVIKFLGDYPFVFLSLAEDEAGNLWAGGLSNSQTSLLKFDGNTVVEFGRSSGLPTIIRKVLLDHSGNLLMASNSGLVVLRKSLRLRIDSLAAGRPYQSPFEIYSIESGLPDDGLYSLAEDSQGNIFIGSAKGVAVLRGGLAEPGKGLAKDGIDHFHRTTGYPIDEVYTVYVDRDGILWVGNFNGLSRLDYQAIVSKDQPLVRRAQVERVWVNDRLVSWRTLMQGSKPASDVNDANAAYKAEEASLFGAPMSDSTRQQMMDHYGSIRFDSVHDFVPVNLRLPYEFNRITIEFGAPAAARPQMMRYQYKLEGYDEQWSPVTEETSAKFGNMNEGTYRFLVRSQVQGPTGPWSEPTVYAFHVLPPWYRSWWAYMSYGFVIIGLLYWARSNIVQRERLKSNLALAKVEQEKEHFELEKAKEVDKVKTSFFTNISHEFRTPLTLIKGPVQDLLEKYASDPKTQQKLKMIQRNSELLLKLINQLLDLARLESGSLKLEKSEADVYSFVRAIASSFDSFARQKNVTVKIDVPNEICSALFDKDKVETILINLVNNAIKFTSHGGAVTVKATTLSTGEGQGEALKLIVKDTGIGIPQDQQQKIFERFHQVSEAHKEVGTGIGLALVKELTEFMGGTIAVTSEVDKGTEFVVTLPVEIVESFKFKVESEDADTVTLRHSLPAEAAAQAGKGDMTKSGFENLSKGVLSDSLINGEQDSTKPHILVIEDNNDVRAFIMDSLGDEFYFLEAENGKIGLEVATREIPDLIISDVMMPEMDGITMAAKIKKDIRTSHIPLILLTAKSSEESKISGLQSGADDYLIKPFNKQELLLKVRNGVARQLKLREKLRAELISSAPKVEVLSEDEKFLQTVKEKILERMSDEQLSVESLAEDMGMSRVQLYRKVSGLTDISVNELIRKLRLRRAAQLLQQKWGPVSQVAYEVGFSNLSYFSKVFKEEFGVLPSEYDQNKL